MHENIRLTLLISIVMLMLAGCSGNEGNAALQPGPSLPVEEAVEESPGLEEMEIEGEWTRSLHHHDGFLNIVNATNTGFDFELEVLAGANTNSIEGNAEMSGNAAYFDLENPACRINFEMNGDVVNVAVAEDEECDVWGMNGTFFDGEYQKGSKPADTDLIQLGILTEKEDDLFKSVIGADYPLFVENMMMVSEEEDLDFQQARVITGFVRGVADSMRAIIMINDDYVYAAVPNGEGSTLYYTNNPDYKDTMPLTIQNWMGDSFLVEDIIYK